MMDNGKMVSMMVAAFNEGYQMGISYGNQVFKESKKIDVKHVDEGPSKLEFTKYNGGIINYGRTLPF